MNEATRYLIVMLGTVAIPFTALMAVGYAARDNKDDFTARMVNWSAGSRPKRYVILAGIILYSIIIAVPTALAATALVDAMVM